MSARKPYTFTVTFEEQRTLAWLSERYTYASFLYDATENNEDGTYTLAMTEPEAWALQESVESGEDGGYLPCLGGRLFDKVVNLLESIV